MPYIRYMPVLYLVMFFLNCLDTTRSPRDGEVNGRGLYICTHYSTRCHVLGHTKTNTHTHTHTEYHFTNRVDMKKAIDAGEFIEWAEYSGNLYGTRYMYTLDIYSCTASTHTLHMQVCMHTHTHTHTHTPHTHTHSKKAVKDVQLNGKVCVLDIDMQVQQMHM